VTRFPSDEAARRAGIGPGDLAHLVELGVLIPDGDDFSRADVRRVQLVRSLVEAGIPLDGIASAVREGSISLAFLDDAAYERFPAVTSETFRAISDRTGVPLELLGVLREAMGLAPPDRDDEMREDELAIVPFLEAQVAAGFRPASIERLLRVQGDSLRRIVEQEAAWWAAEVIEPAVAAGRSLEDVAAGDFSERMAPMMDTALLAMYHGHEARAWTGNIIEGFERVLEHAGLHSRPERIPAVVFLDVSGYTRLTQERGDDAAADLAATIGRLVRRTAIDHGGKAIKWLGDGVMLYFPQPGLAVLAALGVVEDLAAAGLPPAHVGVHAGPVVFQEGDYYGQTVNVSSRIGDYAGPGDVLVSEAVVSASREPAIAFEDVGTVELKGLAAPIRLLRARRADEPAR